MPTPLIELLTLAEREIPRPSTTSASFTATAGGFPRITSSGTLGSGRRRTTGTRRLSSNLGIMYYKGMGINRDYVEAARWFTESASLAS
jgi:hypothetical protein